MDKKKFDKRKYDIEYIRTHKKQFRVDLNILEFNELDVLLKERNLSKTQFLRNAIKELKKK